MKDNPQMEQREYIKIQEDCLKCDGYNTSCISYKPYKKEFATSCTSFVDPKQRGLEDKLK